MLSCCGIEVIKERLLCWLACHFLPDNARTSSHGNRNVESAIWLYNFLRYVNADWHPVAFFCGIFLSFHKYQVKIQQQQQQHKRTLPGTRYQTFTTTTVMFAELINRRPPATNIDLVGIGSNMTAPVRRTKTFSTSHDKLYLLAGICLGVVLTVAFSSMTKVGSMDNLSTTNSLLEEDGWSPIHVFYGERSALPGTENKDWFSQVHQDEIVMDLVGKNGYFLDLAANDAVEFSNTLALERHGWNGLCIEPNPAYWYRLSHRKCTVVGALVGGQKQKVQVKFRGVFGGILGKLDEKLANRKREPDTEEETRFTAPLQDLLARFNVPKMIDYLSLDVEGAEMLIMKNFPFDKYKFKIMTVERPGEDLSALLEQHGYRFLKDLAWWGETLWAHKSTGLTPEHPKIQKIKKEERNKVK